MGNCLKACGKRDTEADGDNSLSPGMLFGIGNPLLDIIATVDANFLYRYNLNPNDAILASPKHLPLYQELVNNHDVDYLAGGAAQNTFRAVQWIVDISKTTTFIGATGNDEFSRILEDSAIHAGINVQYLKWEQYPTGTCAVLITGKDRSLCANLAAAEHFPDDYLLRSENFALIKKAKFYYITGFFITVSLDSIFLVASHAAKANKVLTMNLAANFIPQKFSKELLSIMPYIDILFGNKQETQAFGSAIKLKTRDITEIAKHIAGLSKKTSRPRIVVVTQAEGDVIVVQGTDATEYPVTKLTQDEIQDTNGAGDAFVGGFLAQYIQGEPIDECVNCAIFAATEVIKQSGCSFPLRGYVKQKRIYI